MKIFVCDISIQGRQYHLYVGEKNESCDSSIFLSVKSIDQKWINDITKTACYISEQYYVSKKNRYYLILYFLFSIKSCLYFNDLLSLFDNSLDSLINQLNSVDIQEKLWTQLISFMYENNYKWKYINDYPQLYKGSIKVPFRFYDIKERFTKPFSKVLFYRLAHLLEYYIIKLGVVFWHFSYSLIFQRKLEKKIKQIKKFNAYGESGNLFFQGIDEYGRNILVKRGQKRFTDIYDECVALTFLEKKTNNKQLYLLPYEIKYNNTIVFPFEKQTISLKNANDNKILDYIDIDKLIYFAIDVIDDLYKCKIMHRDVHPGNILVIMNEKEVLGYKLIDFGCAISVLESHTKKGLKNSRKNRYVGSSYRFDDNIINDSYSFLYMIIQLNGFCLEKNGYSLKLLINKLM